MEKQVYLQKVSGEEREGPSLRLVPLQLLRTRDPDATGNGGHADPWLLGDRDGLLDVPQDNVVIIVFGLHSLVIHVHGYCLSLLRP